MAGPACWRSIKGSNETWFDNGGAIHQLNTGVQSQFQGSIVVGTAYAINTPVAQSGNLLQATSPISAYQPLTLGGGHAGSLNVITTPAIAAPVVYGLPAGASTASWVCSGTDFDGNLIPGTTTTLTGVVASWSYPDRDYGRMPVFGGREYFPDLSHRRREQPGVDCVRRRAGVLDQRFWRRYQRWDPTGFERFQSAYLGGGHGYAFDADGDGEYLGGERGAGQHLWDSSYWERIAVA